MNDKHKYLAASGLALGSLFIYSKYSNSNLLESCSNILLGLGDSVPELNDDVSEKVEMKLNVEIVQSFTENLIEPTQAEPVKSQSAEAELIVTDQIISEMLESTTCNFSEQIEEPFARPVSILELVTEKLTFEQFKETEEISAEVQTPKPEIISEPEVTPVLEPEVAPISEQVLEPEVAPVSELEETPVQVEIRADLEPIFTSDEIIPKVNDRPDEITEQDEEFVEMPIVSRYMTNLHILIVLLALLIFEIIMRF